MAIVSNLTLTSVAPVELSMSVVDANNNNAVIAGVLSGLTYSPTDATQDLAVPDTTNLLGVDIHAVSLTGGTSLVATGLFVSTALQADGVTPVVNATLTATLVIVNAVVVAALNPTLVFNQ